MHPSTRMGRRSTSPSIRTWLALALGMMASLPTTVSSAGLLKYTPSSCLLKDTLAAPESQQLKMTALYAQFNQGQTFAGQKANGYNFGATGQYLVSDKDGVRYNSTTGTLLRVVLVGTTQTLAQGYSNMTTYLSTVDIDTNVLSFPIYSNQSALCSGIRTSAGANSTTGSGCPYQGDIALGFSIVLGDSYAATTITSKLIVLDPSVPAKHLACYDLDFTPYYPKYFVYPLVLYFVIALLSLYLVLYVIARLNAAYTAWLQDNETHLASSLTLKISSHTGTLSRRKMWGAIWFNAWAGREVVASGSLRRFGTAELRELLVTMQWASLVGTIAVYWPGFAYPIFAQTAWTTLVYNSTLPFTSPPPSILPNNIEKPPLFSTQMSDLNSPLYLDDSLPNVLLDIEGSPPGLARWARAIGVRPEDVWNICAFTFFIICAAIVGAHLLFFLFDTAIDTFLPSRYSKRRVMRDGLPALTKDREAREGEQHHYSDLGHEYEHFRGNSLSNRPRSAMSAREPSSRSSRHPLVADADVVGDEVFLRDEEMTRPEDVVPSWRLHLALLHGNIVRVVMFFHLPLSIFSVYVLAHRSEIESSKIYSLAGATFAIVCFIFPLVLLARIYYNDLRTLYTSLTHLLELGPLYNTYADECTMFAGMRLGTNIVLAIVIGAMQGVGTAQAAVVLAVEVADTLVTSLWLPWGDNAAMGPLAFLLSLARVVIAVLLVVISPTVAVSVQARSWITYIIFLVQAIVGLMLLWVLIFKFFELIVRLVGRVPFDESRSPRAGGLFGTLRKWDRGAAGGGPTARRRRKKRKGSERRAAAREAATGDRRRPKRRDSPRYSRRLSHQSLETRSVLAANRASHRGSRYDDEAAYIMSPMSSGPWSQTGSTHSSEVIKPGAYSNKGGPVLRSGPNWGEATVVPATNASVMSVVTASSGFQRVGGGRATYTNPYQLATVELDDSNQYPPYPSSSADTYSVKAPGNPRRLSQSAVIEMASATALSNEEEVLSSTSTITGSGNNRQARRSSAPLALPPSSSTLLSNAVPRYDAPSPDKTRKGQRRTSRPSLSGGTPAMKSWGTGLFGRFKRTRPRPSTSDYSDDSDDFTDDEEDEDNVSRGKRPAGGLKGLFATRFAKKADQGKKQQGGERHQEEEVEQLAPAVAPEQAGFSVVRKPRPRPPVTAAPTPTTKSESTEASERTTSSDSARKDADETDETDETNRPTDQHNLTR